MNPLKRSRTTANIVSASDDENEASDNGKNTSEKLIDKLYQTINAEKMTMEKQNQEMKEEIDNLKRRLDGSVFTATALPKALEQLAKKKVEYEDLKRQIGNYKTSEASLQLRLEQSETQRKLAEDKIGKMKSKYNDLKEQLESKSKAEKKLQDHLDKRNKDNKCAMKEIEELKDKHAKEMAELKAKNDDDRKRYEAEISELKSKVSKVKNARADFLKAMDEL